VSTQHYDIAILGGGINGIGIANDAAGRGLSVILIEPQDLASGTSSRSSKLIHGGLRYLEHYEFRLVREALKEREILLNKAPHIIHPLQFIIPHAPHCRPRWLIRLGLVLYDNLSKRHKLKRSQGIALQQVSGTHLLKPEYKNGFVYSDCWVDDARLVVLNAIQARAAGATILTRTQVLQAQKNQAGWDLKYQRADAPEPQSCTATILVNATGPWVETVARELLQIPNPRKLTLSQGSHLIVPKLYEGEQAYLLQNPDQRVVFVIPYQDKYSLIGTTDVPYVGNPADAKISAAEITYLCESVSAYFQQTLTASDVVSSYSGVRPLLTEEGEELASVTRDYLTVLDKEQHLLTVYGGKVTTHRKLAAKALSQLQTIFPHMKAKWTAMVPLPGGDIPNQDLSQFLLECQKTYSWLPKELTKRLVTLYGTRIELILSGCHSLEQLGENFGYTLYQKEVEYLLAHEWANTAEDILWRRTKLGLQFDATNEKQLITFLQKKVAV
jgi:glycerol-3-phosphate dehydrogenase